MSIKNIVVFIGPPGAGKGSLSNICVQKLGWMQLSTGNLCRKHIAEQTALGREIDFAIKSGNLVSDDLITQMVEDWLSLEHGSGNTVILDGYPRTAEQARALDDLLKSKFDGLQLIIIRLDVPDDLLVERLSSRVVCQNKECQAVYSNAAGSLLNPKRSMVCDICSSPLGRRKDDEVAIVRERLATYRYHERVLLEYYKKRGQQIIDLNVEKPLPDIFDEFTRVIGPKMYDKN